MNFLGIGFALCAGIFTQLGGLIQKYVVNQIEILPNSRDLHRKLIKSKLWLLGFAFQMIISSIFYFLAQYYIGPTILPGLMASGLIVLAFGSVYIFHEKLHFKEYSAILFLIIGITAIGFSNLTVDFDQINFYDINLLIRLSIFTFVLFGLLISGKIISIKIKKYMAVFLGLSGGLTFCLSLLWVNPLTISISKVFANSAILLDYILILIGGGMFGFASFFGNFFLSEAYQHGDISKILPLSQIPVQITPILIYFLLFKLEISNNIVILYFFGGAILIIISGFLLGKKQKL